MGEQKPKNSAKDLVWGVLLVLFGIYIVVTSVGMKATSQKTFLDSPGFFPLIVGAILAIFGAILTFIAVKCDGVTELKEVLSGTFLKNFVTGFGFKRVMIMIIMMVVYMYVLIPYVPAVCGLVGIKVNVSFIPSTAIYLTAMFHYLRALNTKNPMVGRLIEIVIAIATPIVVYYLFRLAFSITMP